MTDTLLFGPTSRRSYRADEWGRNRVRIFPDPKTGLQIRLAAARGHLDERARASVGQRLFEVLLPQQLFRPWKVKASRLRG